MKRSEFVRNMQQDLMRDGHLRQVDHDQIELMARGAEAAGVVWDPEENAEWDREVYPAQAVSLAAFQAGAAAERDRIRRELGARLEGVRHIARESLLPIIADICPIYGAEMTDTLTAGLPAQAEEIPPPDQDLIRHAVITKGGDTYSNRRVAEAQLLEWGAVRDYEPVGELMGGEILGDEGPLGQYSMSFRRRDRSPKREPREHLTDGTPCWCEPETEDCAPEVLWESDPGGPGGWAGFRVLADGRMEIAFKPDAWQEHPNPHPALRELARRLLEERQLDADQDRAGERVRAEAPPIWRQVQERSWRALCDRVAALELTVHALWGKVSLLEPRTFQANERIGALKREVQITHARRLDVLESAISAGPDSVFARLLRLEEAVR